MCDYHKWEQNTANWKYYRTKLLIATCIAILTSISSVGSLLLLSTICKKVRTDDFKWIELKYRKCSKLAIIFQAYLNKIMNQHKTSLTLTAYSPPDAL